MKHTMKLTTDTAVTAAMALMAAKLTKMENKDKFAVIRALRALRPVAESYERFCNDAREKLRPDGYLTLTKRQGALTASERGELAAAMDSYNRAVGECIAEELRRELDFDCEPLSSEAFGALLDSNDFNAATMMALQDVLCGKECK